MLTHGEQSLLLDAGVRWKQLLAALPHGLRDIDACLVTHEHKDHCKAVPDLLLRGLQCVMSRGTAESIFPQSAESSCKDFNLILAASSGEVVHLPHFTVRTFRAEHDAAEPLGFLIQARDTRETLVYATDTYYLRYRFPGVHYWLMECNYTMERARESLADDHMKKALFSRLMESHMSLERLCEMLRANDLSEARKIVLVHLSSERGDEQRMVETVWRETHVETVAAHGGDLIELALTPF